MLDSLEVEYFGDLSQGPTDNFDGDADNNIDEINAGTSPNNASPALVFVKPENVSYASSSFTIRWADEDPDSDASIALYYDTDGIGENGTLIASGVSELTVNDLADKYVWDTSTLPFGEYYIYAVLDDGVNPIVTVYSSGVVKVLPQFTLKYKITNPNPGLSSNGFFGAATTVTSSGDIIVGAPMERHPTDTVLAPGRAYVFNGADGSFKYDIVNPIPNTFFRFQEQNLFPFPSLFGFDLDTTPGGDLLIGAPRRNQGTARLAGGAFLFDSNVPASLIHHFRRGPIPVADEQFGQAVAFSGTGEIFIADPVRVGTGGTVYEFDPLAGTKTGEIDSPLSPQIPPDTFGRAIQRTPSGDLLVTAQNGRSYFIDESTNNVEFFVEPVVPVAKPDPDLLSGLFSQYSETAFLPNGDIILGNPDATVLSVAGAGVVHVFDGLTGVLKSTIPNPDPRLMDGFGASVASLPGGDIIALTNGVLNDDLSVFAYILDGITFAPKALIVPPESGVVTIDGPQTVKIMTSLQVGPNGEIVAANAVSEYCENKPLRRSGSGLATGTTGSTKNSTLLVDSSMK